MNCVWTLWCAEIWVCTSQSVDAKKHIVKLYMWRMLKPNVTSRSGAVLNQIAEQRRAYRWLAFPSPARFVSSSVVFQGLIRCHSIKSTFGLAESVAMAAMRKVESPSVPTQSALIKTARSAWRRAAQRGRESFSPNRWQPWTPLRWN